MLPVQEKGEWELNDSVEWIYQPPLHIVCFALAEEAAGQTAADSYTRAFVVSTAD